jgi:signal transduction histidine kinase
LIELINQAFATVEHLSSVKQVRLLTRFGNNSSYFHRLLGNPRIYLQILINFLTNAIEFSPMRNRVEVGLELKEIQPKSTITESMQVNKKSHEVYVKFELSIKDAGCGIAP